MTDSILDSVKKVLGIPPEHTAFDIDVAMHINSTLSTLHQLGVGPEEGFEVTGSDETWSAFVNDVTLVNLVKTYVYLKVKLIFDPPPTSFGIAAAERQITEHESRISIMREERRYS